MDDFSVYCVIPVHNRRETTIRCIEQLRSQRFESLFVVIIDDGSTDGTWEAIQAMTLEKLHVIRGDGSLWWGGAMSLGLDYVDKVSNDTDYILMLNDDVDIDSHFVSNMVSEILTIGSNHILGASQVELSTGKELNKGYKIDFWRVDCSPIPDYSHEAPDALPARGLLIPCYVNTLIGGVNAVVFPHAFSDLEYTCRAREYGMTLSVSETAKVFTALDLDNEVMSPQSLFARIFSSKAKNNFRDGFLFFCLRGPLYHRLTAPLRFVLFKLIKYLSQNNLTR
jgi:N-acetylglucosaminyl-diphospho-decaprenol L-rhamnosyltransferase